MLARRNMALSEADKLALHVEIKLHRNFIHRENEAYYVRRQQAISHPEKFLSCSLDAATQAVFLLPHWAVEDKDVSAYKRIPMHLMGCLCHGRNVYCYSFTDNIKHGANALIEILHRVQLHEWQQTRSLPPTFYVQLDNTTKQCKNKFVLWLSKFTSCMGFSRPRYIFFFSCWPY